MTLIDRFRGFMALVEGEGMSPGEQLVYIHLLNIGNKLGFPEEFRCSDSRLVDLTGLSKNTISTAKNKLKQRGLIEYKTGKFQSRAATTTFRITPVQGGNFGVITGVIDGVKAGVITGVIDGVKAGELIRTEQTRKEKNRIPPLPPKGKSLVENYTSNQELLSALKEFGKMRKSIKKPMQETAWKRALSKLDTLASDDETKLAIVNQSIDHCWQGFFPLDRKRDDSAVQVVSGGKTRAETVVEEALRALNGG
jgi:hypothetical protein